MTDLRDQLPASEAERRLPMSNRKFVTLAVAVLVVPCVVAGVAIGVGVAVGWDKLRTAVANPFGSEGWD